MNISPITNQQQTNFKGWLKFQNNRHVNADQITSVLYDFPDINIIKKPDVLSASFMMSDGLKYGIKYLTRPDNNLIQNILNAGSAKNEVVNINAVLFCEKVSEDTLETINSQNKDTIDSFVKYTSKLGNL